MVNSDGTIYVEYEVRNTLNNVITSDTLYLQQINVDNSWPSKVLSTTTQNQALLPGPIVPDGQGGILATWTISPSSGPVPQYPYQAADVVAGVVGTPYNLPFSPKTVSFGQSPAIVLGENGVAFATEMGTDGTYPGFFTAGGQHLLRVSLGPQWCRRRRKRGCASRAFREGARWTRNTPRLCTFGQLSAWALAYHFCEYFTHKERRICGDKENYSE
ncbi:MAG: hypothetical protein P4N24_06265 [Acidobacteriota bacterium]|nr:hypothetical protein [Acidobacteriota bacterium]